MISQIKERIAQIKKGEIPQGYKATEVGIVPCEWEVISLGQISTLCGGGTPSTARKDFWGGYIPWVSSSDIGIKGIFDISYKKFITDEAIENSATKLCPANSVLIVSRVGVGKVALSTQACCTSQDFTNVIESSVNREFLAYILIKKINAEIQKVQGTSIKGITTAELKLYKLSYPIDMDEQNRIAEILSAQDKVITLKEKLIAQKQEQKKYLMQNLLTGKQRLKGFSGEWESKKIGDICDVRRGGSPRPIEDFLTDEPSGVNWLKIGDVLAESKYIFHTSSKIKKEGLKKTVLLHDGDFILSNSMSFGRPFILKTSVCIHDGWLALSNIYDNIDKDFLYYLLQSQKLQNKFQEFAAGSGVKNLNANIVKEIDIYCPPLPEQEAIAKILTTADKEIELLQKQLEQEKQRKKSLMQLLLTGIVRV